MKEVILKTDLFSFNTFAEFAEKFSLGADDLLFTEHPIYDTCLKPFCENIKTIFREDFGVGEPTDVMTDAIIDAAAGLGFKRLIAVGGGSVIDIAKLLSVSKGRHVDELNDNVASLKRECKFIIAPTTCGTGSEVTNISIINRTSIGTKMGLVSPALFADTAVLVPELLEKLPFYVFATSSIDALIHAVESGLSPKATEFTRLLSYKAIEMIINGYKIIAKEGKDARKPLLARFLKASTFAGIAFGTAGCAAVHALSYPLGGVYHVPHGESNYAMFTGVMKNYIEIKEDGEIEKMMLFFTELLGCGKEEVWEKTEELLNHIIQKKRLNEYGMKEEEIEFFADSVMKCQQRLLANNFVPLDKSRVAKIYRELY